MTSIEVKFPQEDQPSRVSKWRVSVGSVVNAGKVLLVYKDVTTGDSEKKLKATQYGKVIKLLVKPNEIVHPGYV